MCWLVFQLNANLCLALTHSHMHLCPPPATEYHLGLLKAKLAKYRAQLLEPSKSAGAKGEGFDVMKSGDARVALIGFPSVGKVRQHDSCLLVSTWWSENIFTSTTISSCLVLFQMHADSENTQTKPEREVKVWCNLFLCCFTQSTFLSLMTSTASEAASYEFTTLTCIPGVIEVHTLRTLEASNDLYSYSIYIHVWCFSVQRGQHPVTGSARNHRGCCTG